LKEESICTTVNIPAPLYRKLKASAAARGRSIPELMLAGLKTVLVESQRPRPRKVRFPLIVSKGRKVDVTNEQIYKHVEFP
jgi:plasmid stability protein